MRNKIKTLEDAASVLKSLSEKLVVIDTRSNETLEFEKGNDKEKGIFYTYTLVRGDYRAGWSNTVINDVARQLWVARRWYNKTVE